jgi:hypothetical protein
MQRRERKMNKTEIAVGGFLTALVGLAAYTLLSPILPIFPNNEDSIPRESRPQVLERKWDQTVGRGVEPFSLTLRNRERREYLDTNQNGEYDLARDCNEHPCFYAEIGETTGEELVWRK